MRKEFILDAGDGQKLSAFAWEPVNRDVKAVIILIHGLGEHTGRYIEMAEFFAENGIAVFSMDLRGHGRSPGKKGHTAPRKLIHDDVDNLCRTALEAYPEVPVFIYGHSMGGNIGLSHRIHGKFKPRGYIITAPWIILYKKISPAQIIMIKVLSRFLPDLCIKSKLDTEKLSSDISQIDCDRDPLCHGYISVQTALDCDNYANEILKISPVDHGEMLLLHGTDDFICSVEGSRAFMKNAPESVSYKEWKGSYHELHHDKDREQVREQIKSWIFNRV